MFTKLFETLARLGEVVYQHNIKVHASRRVKLIVTPLEDGCSVTLHEGELGDGKPIAWGSVGQDGNLFDALGIESFKEKVAARA